MAGFKKGNQKMKGLFYFHMKFYALLPAEITIIFFDYLKRKLAGKSKASKQPYKSQTILFY
jgi:hypothetical protein